MSEDMTSYWGELNDQSQSRQNFDMRDVYQNRVDENSIMDAPTDIDQLYGYKPFQRAAQRLYNYVNPDPVTRGDKYRVGEDMQPVEKKPQPFMKNGRPNTPRDYAFWAADYLAGFEYNLGNMAYDTVKMYKAPMGAVRAFADAREMYKPVSDLTRTIPAVMSDVTTYAGLYTGLGFVFRKGAQKLASKHVDNILTDILSKAARSPAVIAGSEGAIIEGAAEGMGEAVDARADERSYDFTDPAVGAARGGLFGWGIGKTLEAGPELFNIGKEYFGYLQNKVRNWMPEEVPMRIDEPEFRPPELSAPDAPQTLPETTSVPDTPDAPQPSAPAAAQPTVSMDAANPPSGPAPSRGDVQLELPEIAPPPTQAPTPGMAPEPMEVPTPQQAPDPMMAPAAPMLDVPAHRGPEPIEVPGTDKPLPDIEEVKTAPETAGIETMDEAAEAAELWDLHGEKSPYFQRWTNGAPVVDGNPGATAQFDDPLYLEMERILNTEPVDILQASSMERGMKAFVEQANREVFVTGRPLIVRTKHGSRHSDIEEIDPSFRGENTEAGSAHEGFFSAGKAETSNDYTGEVQNIRYNDMLSFDENVKSRRNIGAIVDWMEIKFGMSTDEAYNIWHNYRDKTPQLDDQPMSFMQLEEAARDVFDGNYWSKTQPTSYPLYKRFKNPYVHDFGGEAYREETYYDIIKKAKAEGHDGAILINTYDSSDPVNMDNVFVSWGDNSVKGKFNSGEFGENPSLLRGAAAVPAAPLIAEQEEPEKPKRDYKRDKNGRFTK